MNSKKRYKEGFIGFSLNYAAVIIALIIGFLLSVIVSNYASEYIEGGVKFFSTILIGVIILLTLVILAFELFHKQIMRKIFGQELEFKSAIADSEEVIDMILKKTLGEPSTDELKSARVAVNKVINTFLMSSFRAKMFRLFISVFAGLGAFYGTILVVKQNQLLEKQNKKIDVQINLEEANRRSSLIFLMSNIMDKVDEELKETTNTNRELSEQTISRIISLSQAFKPYRYYQNDTLINEPLSPERGQLLITLANMKLDTNTALKIFTKSNFSQADLAKNKIENVNLRGVNLEDANLTHTSFKNSNLSNSLLRGANLYQAYLVNTNFTNANLLAADLRNAYLNYANLKGANFMGVDMSGVDLDGANVLMTNLALTKLSYVSLTTRQLKDACFGSTNFDNARVESMDWETYLSGCVQGKKNNNGEETDSSYEMIPNASFFSRGGRLDTLKSTWFNTVTLGSTKKGIQLKK